MARVPELGELVANRYRIQALAREGPGYLTLHAFDRDVEVEVSLLWFRPGLFPSDEARREFLGDAVTIRGLAHPHLRRVYDAHVVRDAVFATAQVGSAANVSKRLGAKRPADEIDIIRYASSMGEGLEAAHRLGHIHGYLVPSDVVEVSNQIKLTGVGLYRAASSDVARDLFWTRRRYIAPEVLAGGTPSARSDVYSMAAILAELASGVSGTEIGEALEALTTSHLRVSDVLGRALSTDPAQRQGGALEVLGELRRQLVDDRVPTSELASVEAPVVFESETSVEIVLEAEEPPQSAHRRPTTERPVESARLAESSLPDFDPHPISLVNADGDPLAGESLSAFESPLGDEGPTLPGPRLAGVGASRPMPKMPKWPDPDSMPTGMNEATTEYRIDTPRARPISRRLPTAPAEKTEPPGPPPRPPSPPPSAKASLVEPPAPVAPVRGPGESFEVDMSPTTLLGTGAPPPAAQASLAPEPPRPPSFVSHKPADEVVAPRTPAMPAIDRPDMQPRLAPLSAMAPRAPVVPKSLGNYAPPRDAAPRQPPKKSRAAFWLWMAAGLMAAILSGLVAVVLVRSKNKTAVAVDAGVVAVAATPDATPLPIDAPPGPCPKMMVVATLSEGEGDARFCVDRFEAPGRGAMPTLEVTLEEASTACLARGARLCTSEEWVTACRGAEEARYPYGARFQREACNASVGAKREIETSGSYPECESAVGAFDMSGNVGEWGAEGFVHGGSAHDRSGGRCSRRWRGRPTKRYKDVGYRCCRETRGAAAAPDPTPSP